VTAFSILAVLIACLGLLGLVAFVIERRTKEIGIRKVLGASVSGIVGLLTKEFVALVVTANIIAWPTAYFILNRWLQNFAYRISLNVWDFLLAGVLALIIAFLTLSYQAIKAATANSVEALRYE
jgi:putative ABC transport system permease protein